MLVSAAAGEGGVRFAALGLARQIRVSIVNQAGESVYDSGLREGSLLDWKADDGLGRRLPDGLYGAMVMVEDVAGLESHRQTAFWIRGGGAVFTERMGKTAAPEARDSVVILGDALLPMMQVTHDGESGRVVSGKGGLRFGTGNLLAGNDAEHMRLTAEGDLGLGTERPAARLDVAGLIRTSEGIQFPDGTIQRTAARSGRVAAIGPIVVAAAPSTFSPAAGPSQLARVESKPVGAGGLTRVYGIEDGINANTFYGADAGSSSTGGHNSFFGASAGKLNSSGLQNSFFGCDAGENTTTGQNNTFVGDAAGLFNTVESNNTYIGAFSAGSSGITGATAVGYRAQVAAGNSLVLGAINGVNGATSDTFVGIGTTTPDRLLVLEGAQALARFTRYNDTAASFAPAYLCERGRGTRTTPLDIVAGDHLGKVQFRGRAGGSMKEYGVFSFVATDTAQNGRFGFFDPGAVNERVSILTSGNVGIGTTAPAERLHVVGNIRLSGTIITGAPAEPVPDYVFEPTYKLRSIEELGEYVARERHLPNVPKASEIEEKGLDVAAFQMKLLEKIEELTLYTVEQANRIRELERKLGELAGQKR